MIELGKPTMLDLGEPGYEVEVLIRNDGQVLWVNVDGICRLRISRIGDAVLTVKDGRKRGRSGGHGR